MKACSFVLSFFLSGRRALMSAVALVFLVLCGASCSRQVIVLQPGAKPPPEQATESGRHHFFILGIGQSEAILPEQICGGLDRIARIETEASVADSFLGLITFNLYTPRTYRVHCSPPSRADERADERAEERAD